MTETAPPRVFVSYSHDNAEHNDRVLDLADRLRADGIDAIIDQYEQSPPQGWPNWCAEEIRKSSFVLMVCTETYLRRVENVDVEAGEGYGTLWEWRLISQQVYDAGSISSKFVPVLLAGSSSEHVPEPVKGATIHQADAAEGYDRLYRLLTNQPVVRKPELGKLRRLPQRIQKWAVQPPVEQEPITGGAPLQSSKLARSEQEPATGGAPLQSSKLARSELRNTYASYLALQQLLSAQTLRTSSNDELLFIIIHQQHELWFKLAIHELDCAINSLMREEANEADCIIAFKRLSRVSAIQHILISSWDVLATLTPDEFFLFRETVGRDGASGFQSIQYRVLEYKLGLKYRYIEFELPTGRTATLDVFENAQTEKEREGLRAALAAPGIYDAVISYMARTLPIFDPRSGPYSRKHQKNAAVFRAWSYIYRNRMGAPELYQLGEKLIDLEDAFRKWRFAHLATVSRVIGSSTGTGGSTGLRYLRQAANQLIENPMYPELWDVRSEMFSRPQEFDLTAAGYVEQ